MNPHVIEWLAAYHDGELPSGRRQQVEEHLKDCPACRAELEALEVLSSLLKADPIPAHTPPERFAAQVQLRLPRTSLPQAKQNAAGLPRWMLGVPLALILVWAFLQAAVWVTSATLTADGLFGSHTALFTPWLTTGGFFQTDASLFLLNAVFLVVITVLLLAWMAFWLAWEKDKNESSIKGGVI
jgi:anti-sigma factor RsiW